MRGKDFFQRARFSGFPEVGTTPKYPAVPLARWVVGVDDTACEASSHQEGACLAGRLGGPTVAPSCAEIHTSALTGFSSTPFRVTVLAYKRPGGQPTRSVLALD